jgi:hypothetical protein
MEGLHRGNDIGVHPPGICLRESRIQLGEERAAGPGIDQTLEYFVDELGPVALGMKLTRERLPGGTESEIEKLRIDGGTAVVGGDLGIHVADGRVGVNESAADVEGHGLD